jgi:hypothetical protein
MGKGVKRRRLFWLASYPKSGNTWTRAFLAAYRLCLDQRRLPAANDVYSTEKLAKLTLKQLRRVSRSESRASIYCALADKPRHHLGELAIHARREQVQQYLALTIPEHCIVKTHNAHQRRWGFSLISSQWTGGAIYLVRNPLDIVDSMSDHADLSYDATIELMNDRNHRLGGLPSPLVTQYVDTWSRHVASWLDHADFPVLLVRYEDMHQAPLKEFTRMVAFLGWEVDAAALQRAIPLACFEALQGLEREQGFQETSRVARSGCFFRRGQIEAWRELLTAPQVGRILADHGSMMERLGYHPSTPSALAVDPRTAV